MKVGFEEWSTTKVIDEIKKECEEYNMASKYTCKLTVEELEAITSWAKNHEHNCTCDNKKDKFLMMIVPEMWSKGYLVYAECCHCGEIFDPLKRCVVLEGVK